MTGCIIEKFGGTSVADYFSMNRSADLLITEASTCLVVLSASAGVTNLLMQLAHGLEESDRFTKLKDLYKIQFNILQHVQHPNIIRQKIKHLLRKITILSKLAFLSTSSSLTDELLSYGELMSTLLFVEILRERNIQAQWFDIRTVMHTNDKFGSAEPDISELAKLSMQKLAPCLKNGIVITQGFIGIEKQGRTTTLGRGSSDYTATLMGEALHATRVNIWTDVTGIYTTDPRIVPFAKRINEIAFKEATEMATFGAKVLHPSTLIPSVRSGIPVFIGSSKEPKAGGTLVHNKITNSSLFRALTLCHKQILLTLCKLNIEKIQCQNFLLEVLKILSRYNMSIRLITTTEINISLILDVATPSVVDYMSSTINPLTELSSLYTIKVEENLTLITLISNQHLNQRSTDKKIFTILQSFNIRMVFYVESNYNVFFLVPHDEADQVVKKLYFHLFNS